MGIMTVELPANRTHRNRGSFLIWAVTQRIGVLEVQEQKTDHSPVLASRYAVTFLAGGSVLQYRVTKPRGEEFYHVTLVPDAEHLDECECMGFLAYRHCKHAEALRAHFSAGHLS